MPPAIGYREFDPRKPVDPARPPQEAVGRPRPVRRRDHRDPPRRTRRRLPVRGEDPRRLHAQAMDPGGRGRRPRGDDKGPAGLPGGRRRRDPGRRQLPQRRQLRACVPARRTAGDAGSARRRQSAPARADAQDRPWSARRTRPAGSRRPLPGVADRCSEWPRATAGRDGTASKRCIPEAELGGLEAELRSQSQGLATYEAEFDHLAELNGPLADKVIQQRVPEPA